MLVLIAWSVGTQSVSLTAVRHCRSSDQCLATHPCCQWSDCQQEEVQRLTARWQHSVLQHLLVAKDQLSTDHQNPLHTDTQTDIQTHRQRYRQTYRHTDIHTHRQTNRHTDRHTDTQTYIQTQ